MKTMKLGKTGIDISRIGLGTWSIGGGSAWGGDHELQTVVDTIREAPKAGVNLIDTAPGYNFGNSEKILGKALEKMNREEVVIITKCGVTWDQEMKGDLFNKVNGIQLYKNLNSESVKKEIVGSLERLGTDYVDVYMTHWQSVEGSVPAGTIWYDYWTNEKYEGGQYVKVETPIDRIPIFVKAGAIIPVADGLVYAEQEPEKPVQIIVYPGADGEFVLYEDEGNNYNFENGAYAMTRFQWKDG